MGAYARNLRANSSYAQNNVVVTVVYTVHVNSPLSRILRPVCTMLPLCDCVGV